MNLLFLHFVKSGSVFCKMEDDLAHFKAAAFSLTHLYKKASSQKQLHHKQGYLDALQDVYNYIQSTTETSRTISVDELIRFITLQKESLESVLNTESVLESSGPTNNHYIPLQSDPNKRIWNELTNAFEPKRCRH